LLTAAIRLSTGLFATEANYNKAYVAYTGTADGFAAGGAPPPSAGLLYGGPIEQFGAQVNNMMIA